MPYGTQFKKELVSVRCLPAVVRGKGMLRISRRDDSLPHGEPLGHLLLYGPRTGQGDASLFRVPDVSAWGRGDNTSNVLLNLFSGDRLSRGRALPGT